MYDNDPSFLVAANRLHHRGLTTPIVYSRDEDVLIGRLEGIDDEVCWRAVDLVAFRAAFIAQVDDYLSARPKAGPFRQRGSKYGLI